MRPHPARGATVYIILMDHHSNLALSSRGAVVSSFWLFTEGGEEGEEDGDSVCLHKNRECMDQRVCVSFLRQIKKPNLVPEPE